MSDHQISVNKTGVVKERAVFFLGVAISLMHIYFNIFSVIPSLWQNSLHYSGFAILCCLLFPFTGSKNQRPVWLVVDLLIGLLAAAAAIYMISMEDAIYARGVTLSRVEWVAGTILIFTAIEFTRRTTGWIIPVLIIVALTYVGWWGSLISGVFKFGGLSAETILFRSVYGDDGLFGNIARISSTFVFMFILFGAFLLRSGAGDFVINLARSVAGRFVGGPGLVAVFSSGLTGTISGSAVANTASTGVITIPLMTKAGFKPKFAAGVEAAASTGGQLMPPIMGAGAFVMASYTQIPYTTIVAVSVLPAILYFATVAFFVRVEAKKSNVQSAEENLKLFTVIKQGGLPFLLPISCLISLLIYGFTPTYAAGISILAVIASSWLTPNKMGPKAIMEALALGAKNMVMTAMLLCSVGLVVNVIATAGVGNTFSLMITEWAGNSMLIAIILIGLASLVLGMGLPVTAAYIVLGTLSAPALYNLIIDLQMVDILVSGNAPEQVKAIMMIVLPPDKLEMLSQPMSAEQARQLLSLIPQDLNNSLREMMVPKEAATFALLSAHMIIFWLSQDSNVTPPVCLTAFTAAAIAKTPPMATGVQSWKIAKGIYIVPLLFAYTNFLGGPWFEVITIFLFALVGLYAFTGAIQGHLEEHLNVVLRLSCVVTAFFLLWPGSLLSHLLALAAFVAIFMFHLKQARMQPAIA